MGEHVRHLTDLRPLAQSRAAVEYIRRLCPALNEEDSMSKTVVNAERNPYRMNAEARGTMVHEGFASLVGAPAPGLAPHDTVRGPGLTAADIDRMCRDHFQLGHRTRDREASREADELRGQLAEAYDEGYTAGRVESAQGLASEVFGRLFEPQVAVVGARSVPRAKTREALDDIEAALKGVQDFVAALFSPHDAGAFERAAAQVARDEG